MAWESVTWACGHTGRKQLRGKTSGREAQVAREAGRKCFACWLLAEWEKSGDPRSKREDRVKLASAIAESKGVRIDSFDLPEVEPVNPLADVATDNLLAELQRRGVIVGETYATGAISHE